ncbi:MAG: phosphatidylserine decarboxylase [Thiovulaceae bacterium]|nr:phosphatidylserine decarboxylase [Sulfurimonadaceae bacterium]
MRNNLYPISKEGFKYIGASVALFVFFTFVDIAFLEFLSFVAILFFIYVFRNPERMIPSYEPQSVTSPVDGMVVSIDEIEDAEYKYAIKIESSYFDVALLRAPLSGTIEILEEQKGAALPLQDSLAEKLNTKATLLFTNATDNKVKVSHLLKRSFDDIALNTIQSKNLLQGARYGSMINGVTTLYLPENFRINIDVGMQILASDTLVGYFS